MIEVIVRLRDAHGWRGDRQLGRVVIANDGGTSTAALGNYVVHAQNGSTGDLKQARVESFPRKTHSALKLLMLALQAVDAAEGL